MPVRLDSLQDKRRVDALVVAPLGDLLAKLNFPDLCPEKEACLGVLRIVAVVDVAKGVRRRRLHYLDAVEGKAAVSKRLKVGRRRLDWLV